MCLYVYAYIHVHVYLYIFPQVRITIIIWKFFLKKLTFLVLLEICSLTILPPAFSSSVAPNYQGKTRIETNSLQGLVSSQLNKY